MYGNENILTTKFLNVLDKWKNEFSSFYNRPVDENYDNTEFYRYILHMKQFREAEMNDSTYIENPQLNCPLSYNEVEKIVNKLKLNKSSGIDQIPNEVLKHHDVMLMLYYLFTKCFDYGLFPSIWLMAVISPITKKFK